MCKRILLVHPHRLVRELLTLLLVEEDGEWTVTSWGSMAEAIPGLGAGLVDLLIIRPEPHELLDAAGIRQHCGIGTGVRILFLLPNASDVMHNVAQACGADACITRQASPKQFLEAMRKVMDAPQRSTRQIDKKRSMRTGTLSEREMEVLQALFAGLTSVRIAERLSISVDTVKTHRRNIAHKLGSHSVAELLLIARREGLL